MSTHTSSPPSPKLGAITRGIVGAWGWLGLTYACLLFAQREQIAGIWELQTGSLGLLPSWLLLLTPVGAAGGLLGRQLGLAATDATVPRRRLAALAAVFAFALAWGVGGGRHLATWETRGGFALVFSLCAGAAVFFGVALVGRLLRAQRGPLVVAASLAFASVVFELANNLILVRLYPAFHLGLSIVSVTSCGAAAALLAWPLKPRPLVPAVIVALAALILLPASRAISGFDNFRWLVSEGSTSLAWGVDFASLVAPPAPLEAELANIPLGARRPSQDVDFRGRDVVLISIDALRADHLGAYGYKRPTTPSMDALAREGVTFEYGYAPTPHTSYSVTSLMTGKYMRPLLLQEAGSDSELWAGLMQKYDYRTAGFYPPAVFFIDTPRFLNFKEQKLGFEYAKVEFAEGDKRIGQIEEYLGTVPSERNVFLWVHLFGPHEPYEKSPEYDFGARDIDLYDSEIRAADESVGRIVRLMRARDPQALIILTADHGEEFGDHGGRYHGTSVFDEQVRVPLIMAGGGLAKSRRVQEPVQTIDLLPTVLSGLRIPVPPRLRGRDLSPLLGQAEPPKGEGRAVAETDDYTMLAEGDFRLICQRRSGACQLYDIAADPAQKVDVASKHPELTEKLRNSARSIAQTHGEFESQGLRAEGKGWPTPILLGISGNAEVAPELAMLLDDADVAIRRKSAELLFSLANTGQSPSLRLALTREEDKDTRAWLSLALTRLGQGAPLVFELLKGDDLSFRRLAALALAEQGDDIGEMELIRWWIAEPPPDFGEAQKILNALGTIRSEKSVPHLIQSLDSVRLRAAIASTLARIGDKDAKAHLALRLNKERFHSARLPLAEAILALGGDDELIVPLRRFLGVPDRLDGGLELALRAGILSDIGGPKDKDRRALKQFSDAGVKVSLIVPPSSENKRKIRLILRARNLGQADENIHIQSAAPVAPLKKGSVRVRSQPQISDQALRILLPGQSSGQASSEKATWHELAVELPESFGARAGHHLSLELFAPGNVEIDAIAALPLRSDLPPPPPEPWQKSESAEE